MLAQNVFCHGLASTKKNLSLEWEKKHGPERAQKFGYRNRIIHKPGSFEVAIQ
jgi:hypothetical protein